MIVWILQSICKNENCKHGDGKNPVYGTRKTLTAEDEIYYVEFLNEVGKKHYGICCCEECAESVRGWYLSLHQKRLTEMEQAKTERRQLKTVNG